MEDLRNGYKLKNSITKQRARIKWDIERDTNSKFFLKVIRYRRRKNYIHGINHQGNWESDPNTVKRVFYEFFENQFRIKARRLTLNVKDLVPSGVKEESVNNLSTQITLEEVEFALRSLDSNKAPGPDGLNEAFIKKIWDYIRSDFMAIIKTFQATRELLKGINSSFITLIPKIETPVSPGDYKPISLINFLMKVLLKVLANRLSPVLDYLIAENQMAFIKGRNISNSILIANEVAHSIIKEKCPGVILKLDFAKAFDSIRWEFLEDTLIAFNFPKNWIGWIKAILQSAKPSVLVNGTPTKEFSMRQGLRQGDPLSPLLFNLVGEMLSRMFFRATECGSFEGVSISPNNVISHLQFADDTLLFIKDDSKSIMGIKMSMKMFEASFGL